VDQVYLDPVGGSQSSTRSTRSHSPAHSTPARAIPDGHDRSPSIIGQYFVRIVTDSDQSLEELNYSNNAGSLPSHIMSRQRTPQRLSSQTTVSAGTPVVLYGVATMTGNGAPAATCPWRFRSWSPARRAR